MKSPRVSKKQWKAGCLAVTLTTASLLTAADSKAPTEVPPATPAPADQVVTLEPIEVTGSYLPYAADAVAIP
jgi:hypothetical protein